VLVESRGLRGKIGGAELHRQVHLVHWKVEAGEGILTSPAGRERRGATAVIKLLEAVVESHTHAAVDTQVVVGLISGATRDGQAGGIARHLGFWSEVRSVHHGGEIQAEVATAALGVSMEGVRVSMAGKAVV